MVDKEFQFYIKNTEFFNTNIRIWKIYISFFISWLVSFEKCTPNNKCVLELIKRTSDVQEKNMLCKRTLNFDQWKTISENYKPVRVWLWLVCKFNGNYCRLRLFSKFIQTQKRKKDKIYILTLDKICILTWKLLVTSS